jgi:hypothetical protein
MGFRPSRILAFPSAADVFVTAKLPGMGIVKAQLSFAIMASEFAGAIRFAVVLDLVKIPIIARLRI